MTPQSVQLIFEDLIKKPNHPTVGKHLKTVALALWYQDFIPNADFLERKDLAFAGYVLDKLTRYNCLSAERKAFLRDSLLSGIERRIEPSSTESISKDVLAKRWGTSTDLKSEFRDLMKYQKRHFKHRKNPVPA